MKLPAVSRRTLLIGGGAGVGLVIAFLAWPRREGGPLRPGPKEAVFGPFLRIATDGRVTLAVPQVEVGMVPSGLGGSPDLIDDGEPGREVPRGEPGVQAVGQERPVGQLGVGDLACGECAHTLRMAQSAWSCSGAAPRPRTC